MSDFWRLAIRNLGRNRRRNIATGIAIALGFAGLILLMGYVQRIEELLRYNSVYLKHIGHLAFYKEEGLDKHSLKPSLYNLSKHERDEIVAYLKSDPNVEIVGSFLKGMGLAGNGCKTVPFVARGVELDVERQIRTRPDLNLSMPEFTQYASGRAPWLEKIDNPVMMSTGLAKLLGKTKTISDFAENSPVSVVDCLADDRMEQIAKDANIQLASGTYAGSFSAIDGELAATFSTGDQQTNNNTLLAPLELLQKLYDTDTVTYVAAFVRDTSKIEQQAQKAEASLRAKGLAVSAYSYLNDDLNDVYTGTINFLMSMAGFISIIVNVVVILSIANSMTLSVIERTREIGTLRAMGFLKSHISSLFVREAILLSLAGLAGGVLIATLTVWGINSSHFMFSPPGVPGTIQFILSPTFLPCFLIALAMFCFTLLATFVTTYKKASQEIVDLLTSVTG
jgi:putative ABC transport system permease protein